MYAPNEKWCFAYTVDMRLSTIGSHLAKWEKMFFIEKWFQNWKKAIEKFTTHEGSLSHTEAKVKWMAKGRPTIGCHMLLQVQKTRRAGFLCQLRAVQYLARQGIAFQGHTDLDGNLKATLLTWSHEVEELKIWVKSNKFCCHQKVNEIISIMGQNLLHTLLEKIKQTILHGFQLSQKKPLMYVTVHS